MNWQLNLNISNVVERGILFKLIPKRFNHNLKERTSVKMETNKFKVISEKLKGMTVADVAITTNAVVIKFSDGTYLDIYLDKATQTLKTSTNKLEG
ncbi:hypothetical protein NQZ71_23190 (plasmid) [Niallia taxi]|uniref:hypothetical protein n=2 Tax=Niallia taxi TaxID=2499688 RepID=UPI0029347D56|nr:hypothetical protein [Niallia taxi]WOD64833.1 hypothetical protein NQZ71_23190 [Niallia taxi]